MNRVYLSSLFSHKDKIKKYSEELASLGVDVTSTWVGEDMKPTVQASELPNYYLRHTAIIDIHDMLNANTLVLFTPTDEDLEKVPKRSLSRGGRNFEAGYFYALVMFNSYLPRGVPPKREIIICGQREGVFHWLYDMAPGADSVRDIYLPKIKQFDTWEQTKRYLTGEKDANTKRETTEVNAEVTQ